MKSVSGRTLSNTCAAGHLLVDKDKRGREFETENVGHYSGRRYCLLCKQEQNDRSAAARMAARRAAGKAQRKLSPRKK